MIVTLDMAKRQLRVTSDADDQTVYEKLEQASDLVFDYLKVDADEYETVGGFDDVPTVVAAAILRVLTNLYDEEHEPIDAHVVNMLRRLRDPALA